MQPRTGGEKKRKTRTESERESEKEHVIVDKRA